MPTFGLLAQIGRICYINDGKDKGKLCALVNVIDGNYALVDGPAIKRQAMNFKSLNLTRFCLKMSHEDKTKTVLKHWKEQGIDDKWMATKWARRDKQRAIRSSLNDFERYKVMKAKRSRNRLIRIEMGRLKRAAKAKEEK
uniref:Large ribosomal subunit protein eL14 n=1 Tax=Trichuris muris TaxID=70415 RepID=A0A5S6R1L8_TRIMR